MSSNASKDNIHEEKQAAAPAVTTTAVPATKAPRKGKKEKEVHNVSAMCLWQALSSTDVRLTMLDDIGRTVRRYPGGQHQPLESDLYSSLLRYLRLLLLRRRQRLRWLSHDFHHCHAPLRRSFQAEGEHQ